MTDRIKLIAEAMGWREHDVDNVHKWMPPHYDKYEKRYAKSWVCLPDPFTDPADDYAVLEWARSGHRDDGKQYLTSDQFVGFDLALEMDAPKYLCDYKIGDFARAYLKSIADD